MEKITNSTKLTFNSPLESGLRSLMILSVAFPFTFDIQKLILFDHLIVHTGDIGGPVSLHPDVPNRKTEILVRRKLIETGLALMMGRNLICRVVDESGISYLAGELSETFISSLTSPYFLELRERARWVVNTFGSQNTETLRDYMRENFNNWVEEFQSIRKIIQN